MKVLGTKSDIEKVRSSVRLPPKVVTRIRESMEESGYSKRDRSKWISESVLNLEGMDRYWELVAEVFMDEGGNEVIPTTLSKGTIRVIQQIIDRCKSNINLAVDQSDVIRAAIVCRLVKEGGGLVI